MKGITKKILAIIIAATFAMSMFAVGASAYVDEESEYFFDDFYSSTIIDHIYYEVEYYDDYAFATVVDFELDDEGYPLVAESVTIPETVECDGEDVPVTAIGYYAFADCHSLREITLPETITAIYDYAFAGAASLSKVVIPESIEFDYFGTYVFDGTPALGYFAENCADGEVIVGQNVLLAYLGNDAEYTVPDEIDYMAEYCFFMSGVEEVVLNESITEIREYAFASCRNLTEITIPDNITYLGNGAFSNCESLETVNLGDSFELFGYNVFEGTKVKDIYIGASVVDVIGAFIGCETIENITVSDENPHYYVDGDAVYYAYTDENGDVYSTAIEYYIITSDATTFTIPDHVDIVAAYAFHNCDQLDEVIISAPGGVNIDSNAFANCEFDSFDFSMVMGIGYGAFRSCKNLTEADLSNVEYIEDSAFENCTSLADVTFSDDLYYLGSRAFANTAITEVAIGGYETEIGENAFADCTELTSVYFNDGVAILYGNLFINCPELETVFISKNIYYIDYYAFQDCEDVTFEIVKHSDSANTIIEFAEDAENDVTNYEFVDTLTIFERIANFFANIFAAILDFFTFW